MSASLLVTATPTVDSAEDVTWPAWEKPSLVLMYLEMQVNRQEKSSGKGNNTGNRLQLLAANHPISIHANSTTAGLLWCCSLILVPHVLSQAVRLLRGH